MRLQILTLTLSLLALPQSAVSQVAAGGGAPVDLPTQATQDSTVRQVNSLVTIGTITTVSNMMFTQTFATTALGTWDLGPTPRAGTIGLGDIQGTVGKVKGEKGGKRWLGARAAPTWGW